MGWHGIVDGWVGVGWGGVAECLGGYQELFLFCPSSGAVVQLGCRDNEEATVTGIDEYGYLCVRTRNTGEELTLQPDGNSFDITRNLIVMK